MMLGALVWLARFVEQKRGSGVVRRQFHPRHDRRPLKAVFVEPSARVRLRDHDFICVEVMAVCTANVNLAVPFGMPGPNYESGVLRL